MMNTVLKELAAIKPQSDGDFAFEIFSGLLSDCNNQFYCSDLIEGLKVVSDKEQETINSGEYDDADFIGYYLINGQDVWLDDLADKLIDVKTNKKILHDTWGPGYQVIA